MKALFLYSILYLVLFGFTDILHHKFGVKAETTRKIVHICTGMIALSFPVYLTEFWQAAVLCISFLGLLFVCERFCWLQSITGIKRKSCGSWLFALVVLFCFWIQWKTGNLRYYFIPLLILSLADPAAAIIGQKWRFRPFRIFGQAKTVGGSLAFLLVCLAILWGFHPEPLHLNQLPILGVMALVITFTEAISVNGWDNLTIPVVAVGLIYLTN
jgi:dolichol kinase